MLCQVRLDGAPYTIPLTTRWEIPQEGRLDFDFRGMPRSTTMDDVADQRVFDVLKTMANNPKSMVRFLRDATRTGRS
jgi:hypothetical protein